MTDQKKYLPKWAEAEFSQLRAKVESLEADNAKLRGEVTGEPWGWIPGAVVASPLSSTDIPVLSAQHGKKYRKVELGEEDDAHRWEIQLNEDNSLTVRSPYFSDGRMAVLPSVTNVVEIVMVDR